ncbi:helix-turn-helix transcriptional regulator [Thermomonas sp.]|uniref:helix-turn-helix domain-containing protein n=1 Tax=Thermomonas sp. TaxID=1971895 RepID=UPI00262E9898|nr:helix-turn-helix transcriptional regulator [Thermomonas sp.]MCO5055457.1 helix-turn-helix domain-containing protein [Thermomonas sp.]
MSSDFPFPSQRDARIARSTQTELGKLAGLPSTTISHFESDSRKPSFDNLRRLHQSAGGQHDYLMGITDTPDASAAATRIARHLSNATEELEISMLEAVAKSIADRRKPE